MCGSGEEETELRKYQPVDGLMTGILKGLQEEKFPGSCADNGNGESLEYIHRFTELEDNDFTETWKALAQSEDVLYLNLETYAGMEDISGIRMLLIWQMFFIMQNRKEMISGYGLHPW